MMTMSVFIPYFQLCQLMMQERIFAPVGSKRRQTECVFEDSSTRFFRFTETALLETSTLEDEEGTPLDEEADVVSTR